MKKQSYIILLVLILSSVSYFFLRDNEVTVYLTIADADTYKIPLKVFIDKEKIFDDSLVNFYDCKVIKTNLTTGKHTLELIANNGEHYQQESFFVKGNQHLVIQCFSPFRAQNYYSGYVCDSCQLGK